MSSAQNGGTALGSAQQGMAGLSVGNGVGGAGVGPGAMVAVGKVKNVSLPAPDLSQVGGSLSLKSNNLMHIHFAPHRLAICSSTQDLGM